MWFNIESMHFLCCCCCFFSEQHKLAIVKNQRGRRLHTGLFGFILLCTGLCCTVLIEGTVWDAVRHSSPLSINDSLNHKLKAIIWSDRPSFYSESSLLLCIYFFNGCTLCTAKPRQGSSILRLHFLVSLKHVWRMSALSEGGRDGVSFFFCGVCFQYLYLSI